MNRIARAAMIGGIAMGAPILLAPSAVAAPMESAKKDINIFVVEKATVGHNGPVYVVETGPGNLAYSNVTDSPKASPKVGNESIKTGDHKTTLKGGKGNTAINEVEGSEQESVKNAGGKGHGQKATAQEAAAQEAQEAKPEAAAQEAAPQEAQAQEASAQEAKPEAAAQEAEAEEAAPQQAAAQEAAPQEAAAQEAAPQEAAAQEAAPQEAAAQEAAPQEAAAQEAAPQEAAAQEAAPQEAAAQEAAPQQAQAEEAGAPQQGARHGDKGGHKGGPDNVFAAKKSTVGNNGPTLVAESGPGNLAYSNVTGSPKASPKVGNESIKTGDFHTTFKGGKGNTAVNEVEGSEQETVK
ncbi:hypothetical protein [Actinomadura sp. WMMB 499]|uniref:hypothetical protein n=1 Tax=Actinomadura sp. WMMB 499 TaxID=1219491 RepID=UPI001243D00D|nr:hypothetical protein [Actinomadura sp. WMMB 499]QFG21950.1 hypothetical protein F7P10_13280 [Actinomadura sp. WMMB 499]